MCKASDNEILASAVEMNGIVVTLEAPRKWSKWLNTYSSDLAPV